MKRFLLFLILGFSTALSNVAIAANTTVELQPVSRLQSYPLIDAVIKKDGTVSLWYRYGANTRLLRVPIEGLRVFEQKDDYKNKRTTVEWEGIVWEESVGKADIYVPDKKASEEWQKLLDNVVGNIPRIVLPRTE